MPEIMRPVAADRLGSAFWRMKIGRQLHKFYPGLVALLVITLSACHAVHQKPAAEPARATVPSVRQTTAQNPLAGCQQCHVDVELKFIKSRHFQAQVACRDCHGPSQGHLADENNAVKPDQVFARQNVDRFCARCHDCSRPGGHQLSGEAIAEKRVCTDCHGSHTS